MKKVLVVTGTRADYGIYYPILRVIEQDADLDLHILVTGMHLSPQYGNTIESIQKDGFKISAKVDNLLQGSTHANMARSIGLGIVGMTQAFESIDPDCVLVLGDRGEMLAAAIVSSHMNIPTLHFHGGEVSGTIDESVRHAISKLAHLHLVATEGSRDRLIKLGEDPWRIHVVGAPRIETIQSSSFPRFQEIKEKYHLQVSDPYCLFVYHPVTTEASEMNDKELKQIFQTLLEEYKDIICVMPNADAGSEMIQSAYRELENQSNIHFVTNFGQFDYLTVLKNAALLVGNSSSGIIEAASFHIPVINIGSRQHRRERSENVVDVELNNDKLKQALKYIKTEQFQSILRNVTNVYGKGNTSALAMEIIKNLENSSRLIQKTITY